MSLSEASRLHKALGHSARLRILRMLADGPLCVCQITAVLELAPSTVSAHLRGLREAELIVERKVGRWVHYGLAGDARARGVVRRLQRDLTGDPIIERDEAILRDLRAVPPDELCRADLDLGKLGIPRALTGRN